MVAGGKSREQGPAPSRSGGRRAITAALAACLVLGTTGGAAQETDGSRLAATLIRAAVERTQHDVRYDGRYLPLDYPGGDVPLNTGVCTDLIIRAYRAAGYDLQVLVHEDMRDSFEAYPDLWGLKGPDSNIDHRRVPNLEVFFARNGSSLPASPDPKDYEPGDLVTWKLPGGRPHIGLVIDRRTGDGARPLIVHNVGMGPRIEDVLFEYEIAGHFRYPRSDR